MEIVTYVGRACWDCRAGERAEELLTGLLGGEGEGVTE